MAVKIKRIEHLGLAVKDPQAALEFWSKHLGLQLTHTEDVPSDAVKTYFLPVGETQIELLEATSPDSPVQKFIDKRGTGIHHLCIEVENLSELLQKMKRDGVTLINDTPRPGAHGYSVAFVHPKSTGGILLELSEKLKG